MFVIQLWIVRYASSTQVPLTHRAEVHESTCTQASVNETKNMAEVVQNVMEASNDRWRKIVETLQASQAPMHADGPGMKAKPHKYGGDPSDGSVDAWISLMRMYLESCKGAERNRVLTLPTFLHKHAQAWIMRKPDDERNSCDKILKLLSKRFGIGESPNHARLQFDTRKQEITERLDNF